MPPWAGALRGREKGFQPNVSFLGPIRVAGRPPPHGQSSRAKAAGAERQDKAAASAGSHRARQGLSAEPGGWPRTATRLLGEPRARWPGSGSLGAPSPPGARICPGPTGGGPRRHVRRPGPRDPAARPPAPPPAPPLRPPLAGGSRAPTPLRSRRLGLVGRRAAAAGLPGTPAGRGGWARAGAHGGPFPSLRLPRGPGRRVPFLLRAPRARVPRPPVHRRCSQAGDGRPAPHR